MTNFCAQKPSKNDETTCTTIGISKGTWSSSSKKFYTLFKEIKEKQKSC